MYFSNLDLLKPISAVNDSVKETARGLGLPDVNGHGVRHVLQGRIGVVLEGGAGNEGNI